MTTSTAHPHVREADPVEVEDGHRSKRRICERIWPRMDLRMLPTQRRVSVENPHGVCVKVMVRLWIDNGYVVANADPNGRVFGECPDASCVFTRENELESERLALESI